MFGDNTKKMSVLKKEILFFFPNQEKNQEVNKKYENFTIELVSKLKLKQENKNKDFIINKQSITSFSFKNNKKESIINPNLEYFKNKDLNIKKINLPLKKEKTIFEDYKLLIKLNKNNNYKSINNIRKYINNITIFNSKNASSLSNNYNYKFNSSTTANNKLTNNLYTFLESSFLSIYSLISKPIFISTPDKVVIHLFICSFSILKRLKPIKVKNMIIKSKELKLNYEKNIIKLKIISQLLALYFKKPVEFEIVKLRYPFYNSSILAKYLSYYINQIKLRKIKYNLFKIAKIKTRKQNLNNKHFSIPSYLAGIKIKVAGRLLTQRVIPRKTVKTITTGKFARGKVIYLENARFTNKNKRGAFTITISTSYLKN